MEAIRGRPVSDRVQEFGFKLGLALVAALMICATYNDISRVITGCPRRVEMSCRS